MALQVPLLCLALSGVDGGAGYQNCVRQSILLGGCSASRSIFAGAMSAALQSHQGHVVPQTWIRQVSVHEKMAVVAATICKL